MISKYIALVFASTALAGCCLSPNGCYAPLPGAPVAWDGLGTAPTETETTGATEDRPRKTARVKKEIIIGPIGAAAAEPKPKLTGREAFLQQEAADRVEEEIEGCGNAVLVRPHPPPTVVIGHDQQMPLALRDRRSQLVSATDNGRPQV